MTTNLLKAIYNIVENTVKNPTSGIGEHSSGSNRMNNMGESLEDYIKDAFSDALGESSENIKMEKYQQNFSYCGNQNNPPDFMIREGDAVEVKKIQSDKPSIALNSSYPKSKLYSDSPMITTACKNCEVWDTKDVLYAIGTVKKSFLKSLWLVYGDCYAADREIYEKIKNKISNGLKNISDIEFSVTKEIGRVNRVDPLGVTNLRIRGMWQIEHPIKVFNYLKQGDENSGIFSLKVVMSSTKYNSFPENDRLELEKLPYSGFKIENVKIQSPDNPANLLDAKFITFIL